MNGFSYQKILYYFFSSFFISWLTAAILIRNSKYINVFSMSDKRRKQEHPIPLLGGLAIHGGILFFLLLTTIFNNHLIFELNFYLSALLLCLCGGAMDDKLELKPFHKFTLQNIIAVLLIASFQNTETPIHHFLTKSPILIYCIQWFWIMGLMNSMNLIDGLDGLASGIALITILFLTMFSFKTFDSVSAVNIASIASILGFLLWNYHPAKIYLGESGSSLLGILIFTASMSLESTSASFLTIFAPILAVGVPALDTAIAIIRRSSRRISFGHADRDHLHHRLLRLGIKHEMVVWILWGITAYLCLLSYSLFHNNESTLFNVMLSLTGVSLIVFLVVLMERKLYTYLKNFGDQMLQVMDNQSYGSITSFMRIMNLYEQKVPFTAYRLNLENCIQTLLVFSPGRILTFYTDLASYFKRDSNSIELYYEGSTKLVIIYKLEPGGSEKFLYSDLMESLQKFEQEKSIDLYLSLPSSVVEIDTKLVTQTKNNEPQYGRRRSDTFFSKKGIK